jgi:hypothetical protein
MFKVVLTAAMATILIVCVSICLADETKKLTLTDGKQVVGEVTKTDTGYNVKTKYGTFQYTFDQVASVADVGTPQDEYQQRLAKIDANSAQDHFELAKWAWANGMADTALAEVQQALKLKPGNDEYDALRRQIEAKIKSAPAPTTRGGPASTTKNGGEKVDLAHAMLSDQDIAAIRLAELSLDDRVTESASVEFKNKCKDRVKANMNAQDQRAFDRLAAIDQARFMLKNFAASDAALLTDIVIKSSPKVMSDFHSKIWPVLVNNCASTACHGGEKGKGALKLFNNGGDKDKVEYTNFVLLDGYVSKDGQRMLDRDHPERSLLLQYGLPAADAQVKHPVVDLPNPPFRSAKSDVYQKVEDWIGELKMPHPDYPLKYQPPAGMTLNFGSDVMPTTTAPASGPSTRPAQK